MKRYSFLIYLVAVTFLAACEEKQEAYVYKGPIDSSSIGLTKKPDTLTKAQFPRPELPEGLIIDTGSDNPFAADTAYLPHNQTPADTRNMPNYSSSLQNP